MNLKIILSSLLGFRNLSVEEFENLQQKEKRKDIKANEMAIKFYSFLLVIGILIMFNIETFNYRIVSLFLIPIIFGAEEKFENWIPILELTMIFDILNHEMFNYKIGFLIVGLITFLIIVSFKISDLIFDYVEKKYLMCENINNNNLLTILSTCCLISFIMAFIMPFIMPFFLNIVFLLATIIFVIVRIDQTEPKRKQLIEQLTQKHLDNWKQLLQQQKKELQQLAQQNQQNQQEQLLKLQRLHQIQSQQLHNQFYQLSKDFIRSSQESQLQNTLEKNLNAAS